MQTLCIAHRGASAEAPENTLEAFKRALEVGADGIELDVRTCSDGASVVFHDAFLRRLTGEPGRVANRTWSELRRLRVGGEPIPRLEDALSLARGRILVQIELKRGAGVESILKAIRRTSTARSSILSSFDLPLLRGAQFLAPSIPRLLIADSGARAVRRAQDVGAVGVSLNYRKIASSASVRAIQGLGLRVWCWTVNDRRAIQRLAAWGVDAVVGDDPLKMRECLKRPVFRLTHR